MNARRTIPIFLLGTTILFGALAARGETPATAPAAAAADGKALFLSNKCNTCHTIQALGIEKKKSESAEEAKEKDKEKDLKPPDLSGVGLERKADWIMKFLKKTETIKGDKHPRGWRGTDADLKTVATWLEGQKAAKKK